ncbi:MAG: hypothetical protein ACU836_04590 [Gammaproteobacteria bacterium]
MDGYWEGLNKKVQALSSHWSAYMLIGSFALYLLGYLTLRFHLTVLGIGVDLAVMDERYLFTGAKFLIYLVSAFPSLILLVLLLAAPFFLVYWVLPAALRSELKAFARVRGEGIRCWFLVSNRLTLAGILFSLLIIQLVMRQCFLLNNLLLADSLPSEPFWFHSLLLAETDGPIALFFNALLAAALISLGCLRAANNVPDKTPSSVWLNGLLSFLVGVQLLLFPVNYGILVVDKSMPRVSGMDEPGDLNAGERAWLVWEGRVGKTFLLKKQGADGYGKRLITLPIEQVKKLEILRYDRIFPVLFGQAAVPASHGSKEGA